MDKNEKRKNSSDKAKFPLFHRHSSPHILELNKNMKVNIPDNKFEDFTPDECPLPPNLKI